PPAKSSSRPASTCPCSLRCCAPVPSDPSLMAAMSHGSGRRTERPEELGQLNPIFNISEADQEVAQELSPWTPSGGLSLPCSRCRPVESPLLCGLHALHS
ncbi:MAG: hypothetical protein ACPIOQ_71665, partial [Promethearchaeia archaeon]